MARLIKVTSDIGKAIQKVMAMDTIIQRASAETLKYVGEQTGREAARQIRDTRYAPKLTISEILKGRTTRVGGKYNPPDKAMVWMSKPPSQSTATRSQSVTVNLSSSSVPLWYFNPRDHTVQTRYGPRYGVIVTVFGKRTVTGGFHLKGRGQNLKQGSPKGKGSYDRDSRVFKREGGELRMFKFISPARLLDNFSKLDYLENYGRQKFGERFQRNFERQMRQILK